jgi:DNA-binding response OmpR family regulator
MTCPCCGQGLPEKDLLVDLNSNKAVKDGHEIHLQPQQAEVLYTLWKAAPKQVTHTDLSYALWGGLNGPEQPTQVIRTVICNLRRKLREVGVKIQTIDSRGYRLEVQ